MQNKRVLCWLRQSRKHLLSHKHTGMRFNHAMIRQTMRTDRSLASQFTVFPCDGKNGFNFVAVALKLVVEKTRSKSTRV